MVFVKNILTSEGSTFQIHQYTLIAVLMIAVKNVFDNYDDYYEEYALAA